MEKFAVSCMCDFYFCQKFTTLFQYARRETQSFLWQETHYSWLIFYSDKADKNTCYIDF